MPALAEDISYFKDVIVLYVFCLRQRIIESSQFEQPIDDVVVALRLTTDTQEGLVIDGIAFQSQQEYVDVFVIFAHIVSMPTKRIIVVEDAPDDDLIERGSIAEALLFYILIGDIHNIQ